MLYCTLQVMMAVGITAAICLALTLFAFQTRWDFTVMGGFLLCATVVLMLFGKSLFCFTIFIDQWTTFRFGEGIAILKTFGHYLGTGLIKFYFIFKTFYSYKIVSEISQKSNYYFQV